jgi:hypothetical protein
MPDNLGARSIGVTMAAMLMIWAAPAPVVGRPVTIAVDSQRGSHHELDETAEQYAKRAEMQPNDPERWYALARYCSEKARTDTRLTRARAKEYVLHGVAMNFHALVINPDYLDALHLQDTLLRQQATFEKDAATRKRVIAQADAIKRYADALVAKGKEKH